MTDPKPEQSTTGWQNWRGRPNRPPMTSPPGGGSKSPLLELRMGNGAVLRAYRRGGPTGRDAWAEWWSPADASNGQRLAVRELGGVVAWRLAAQPVDGGAAL